MHSMRSPLFTLVLAALLALRGVLLGSLENQPSGTVIDPPPIDEPALISRLVAMTQPSPGERAIIVFDRGTTRGSRMDCGTSSAAVSTRTFSSKTARA